MSLKHAWYYCVEVSNALLKAGLYAVIISAASYTLFCVGDLTYEAVYESLYKELMELKQDFFLQEFYGNVDQDKQRIFDLRLNLLFAYGASSFKLYLLSRYLTQKVDQLIVLAQKVDTLMQKATHDPVLQQQCKVSLQEIMTLIAHGINNQSLNKISISTLKDNYATL